MDYLILVRAYIKITWLAGKDKNKNLIKWNSKNTLHADKVMSALKNKNYYIVIKKREKGYPLDKENGFTNYINVKPDMIIEKDLYFPSSLFFIPFISDICVFLGHKTQGTESLIDTYTYFGKKVLHYNIEAIKKEKFINEICTTQNNCLDYNIIKKYPSTILVDYINEYIR